MPSPIIEPERTDQEFVNPFAKYSSTAERLEAEELYLQENGWEPTGQCDILGRKAWFDPEGAGPKSAVPGPEIQLPQRGGGFETIKQAQVPAASWRYAHDRAVAIQQMRDRSSGKHESLQERANRMGRQLDTMREAIGLFMHNVEKWAKRRMPEKPDNIQAELMNMKQTLYSLAVECRAKVESCVGPTTEKSDE